jgi:predicted transcriptional regulator
MTAKIEDKRVYELLKKLWEQNIKPHMLFLILKTHEDGEFHRGKQLVDAGYDLTEVYDGIEILVAKGDLTRQGKKTKITQKGRKMLKLVDEIIETASKIIIT